MQHIVLDTSILVAAAHAENSASRQIVEACLRQELIAVASRAIKAEYELILARAVRKSDYDEELAELLEGLQLVEPKEVPRVVPDDAEDDKFVAAATTGRARWIVTNDRHLLELDPYQDVRIISPSEFADGMLP